MASGNQPERGKGGRDAAFSLFLLLFAATVLISGGATPHAQAFLRVAAFLAAARFLWTPGNWPGKVSPYPFLAGGFVLLALGHAFSSVYFWVSFQHALNIAAAAILLALAVRFFRDSYEARVDRFSATASALALGLALLAAVQRTAWGDPRPQGTFDNPNLLAEFLAGTALFLLARFLGGADRREIRFGTLALGALLFSAALLLPASRGVLVGAVPAAGLLLVWRFGARAGVAALLAGGVPAAALLGRPALARFFEADPYGYGRLAIWKGAVRTFLDHPFGVGLGGFKYYWYSVQSPFEGAFLRYGKMASTAHSEYLEVLSGLGAAGLVLFLLLLGVPMTQAFRRRAEIPTPRRWVVAGASSALLLSGCNALLIHNFHSLGIVFFDLLLLGALLSSLPEEPSRHAVPLPKALRPAGLAAFLLLLAVSATSYAGTLLYQEGARRHRDGRTDRAEALLRTASRINPFRATVPDAISAVRYARFREAMTAREAPEGAAPLLDEAIRMEAAALSLCPRETRYSLRLAKMLNERSLLRGDPGDRLVAQRFADTVLELNPFSAEGFWTRATIRAGSGDLPGAEDDLRRSVSLEPNFCRGYFDLAALAGSVRPAEAAGWREKGEECRRRATARALPGQEWYLGEPEDG